MNKYQLLIEYLNEQGYLQISQDSERMEAFIQNLTAEQLKSIMIDLNKQLRNIPKEQECTSSGMIAGDLVAPSITIRDEILENLVESLKRVQDNKKRAELIYYTTLNLHMFSDGNGRTARLLYDLTANELGDECWYIHDDKSSHKYEGSFEQYKEMVDITEINQLTSGYLKSLIEPDLKKAYPELSKTIYITAGMRMDSEFTKDIMPETISEEMSQEETGEINSIMADSFGADYSISGLAMLAVAERKGQLQEWIDYDNKCIAEAGFADEFNGTRFCLRAWRNPPMLQNWTEDDYREIIKVGNFYKLQEFKILNDMFVNPEKYRGFRKQFDDQSL